MINIYHFVRCSWYARLCGFEIETSIHTPIVSNNYDMYAVRPWESDRQLTVHRVSPAPQPKARPAEVIFKLCPPSLVKTIAKI